MGLFNKKPTTLEEVKKAYEALSDDDKKAFHQSISDRVHESIGEQEHHAGEKDSQSAADREHEALGEEHAEGKGDVDELHENDESTDENREDAADDQTKDVTADAPKEETGAEDVSQEDASKAADNRDDIIAQLTDRVASLEQALKEFGELKEKMEDYTRKQAESFGLKGQAVGGNKDFADMTADELKSAILSGKN